MTEKSYYHNGAVAGDAAEAPYSALLYTTLNSILMHSFHSYIFEDVAGELLAPTAAAGLTVDVGAGKAFVAGILYSNGAAVNLTFAANNSGLNRIDRIIIRVDWGAQTARLAVKMGVPSIVAAPPPVTQVVGDIYEMPIAQVYIPDALAAMTDEYIYDERQISYEYKNITDSWSYVNQNIMYNTELMAAAGTSQAGGAVARGYAPMGWSLVGNAEAELADKFSQMERGSTVLTTLPGIADSLNTTLYNISIATTLPTTTKLLIEVIQGEVYLSVGAVDRIIPVTDGPVEMIFRNTHGVGLTNLAFVIGNNLTTETIFKLGQATVAYGNEGAPFQSKREYILFSRPISVPNFTGAENYPTGVTEYLELQNELCQGITASLIKLGSIANAGGSATLQSTDTGIDYLSTYNAVSAIFGFVYNQGWVGVEPVATYPTNARIQRYYINAILNGRVDIDHVGIIT